MRTLQLQDKMSFSGVTADQKRIALPKVFARALILSVKYNVTDSGISAGENVNGCINFFRAGDQSNPLIYAERDELDDLVAVMAPDGYDVTGLYTDAQPTTATDAYAQYIFFGPFDFRKCASPALTLALRAITDEFGGATVFTATVTVTLITETAPASVASYRFAREYRATSTRHEIAPASGPITGLYLIGSATANYSRITVQNHLGEYLVDVDDPFAAMQLYCAKMALAATSAAGVLFIPTEVPDGSDRKIIVQNGTTQTLTAFIRQLV